MAVQIGAALRRIVDLAQEILDHVQRVQGLGENEPGTITRIITVASGRNLSNFMTPKSGQNKLTISIVFQLHFFVARCFKEAVCNELYLNNSSRIVMIAGLF